MTGTEEMAPFVVRAHLSSGLAHATPWGISLDGILAAELWADHKAAALDRGEYVPALTPECAPPDLELPLARCELAGEDWHWCATCSFPEDPAGDPVVRHWASRADHRGLEQLSHTLPAVISDRQGRYRARYMPLMITNTRTVTWRGVGDLDAVATILGGLDVIGKKRAHGEGRVLRWEFEHCPAADRWAAAHLHSDGTLGRTTPPACLPDRLEPESAGFGLAGLRPPYMHPTRMRQLHLPR
ncbi:hypothetical protein [Rhodococcus opacus]|uniref:hypothetical protein n=1 Tax=Rhodococcus opacus TaxID=37919 RepID=UPI0006BB4786|nr:hypothetical protein [Rhodococcus opacus]